MQKTASQKAKLKVKYDKAQKELKKKDEMRKLFL